MDRGAWKAAVHGVAKSWTWLSDFTLTFHFHALEKKIATHSSVLAWRIPGTEELGGLPSLGSHRVGHDWSDLAAAAAAGQEYWSGLPCPPQGDLSDPVVEPVMSLALAGGFFTNSATWEAQGCGMCHIYIHRHKYTHIHPPWNMTLPVKRKKLKMK